MSAYASPFATRFYKVMRTSPAKLYDIPSLPPFPEGWYFIGSRRAIQKRTTDPKDLDR